MNKYQEALNNVNSLAQTSDYYKENKDKQSLDLLQQLIDKHDILIIHVKLAIEMIDNGSKYAVETLKEALENER